MRGTLDRGVADRMGRNVVLTVRNGGSMDPREPHAPAVFRSAGAMALPAIRAPKDARMAAVEVIAHRLT